MTRALLSDGNMQGIHIMTRYGYLSAIIIWFVACSTEDTSSAIEAPDLDAAQNSSVHADSVSASWSPPRPKSIDERRTERERMVNEQIIRRTFGAPAVQSETVMKAMRTVPRHVFVPEALQTQAYADTPLPIGLGQTISQPYIVAFMTELLSIDAASRVLEIGTGSGYQAAILAQLTPHVYSIEIIKPLADLAREVLDDQGYDQVQTRHADGYYGWEDAGPFDAIIVTCAAGHLPPALWAQLKPGGRIGVPIGNVSEVQRLIILEKAEDGSRLSRTVMPVRFVPMTGQMEQ